MTDDKVIVGFIGAGGIARSHAYSLNSLRFYYNDLPGLQLKAVCSQKESNCSSFARQFGFSAACSFEELTADNDINTIFILGPNKVHYEHFSTAINMPSVRRIYIEKPVCSGSDEEKAIADLGSSHPEIRIQVGFQYLFSASVREALRVWKSGIFGKPVHFGLKYYHSDYLNKEYRDKRITRLTPAPDGGAMADLGSHAVSLLVAFLGERLTITGALQAGSFMDVPEDSDLFSLITLYDCTSGAAGTLTASRIASGTGDSLSLELYAENGALRYSSDNADYFEYYTEDSGVWTKKMVGSNFKPVTSFPSGHVPAGWLRAMVHAHYVFLTGDNNEQFVPDLQHGLAVQRIVTETALHLEKFRNNIKTLKQTP